MTAPSDDLRAPLGLMGGTFDPVHFGHLRLALDAAEALQLPKVRWIPSGAPGHRDTPHASTTDRQAMLELAIATEPRFSLDTAELYSDTPTYTLYMLQRLRRELGESRSLVMLLGMDSFTTLASWRHWEQLFDLAHFAVAERPGYALDIDQLPLPLAQAYRARRADATAVHESAHGSIVHFPSVRLDISASDLRARLVRGSSARYLIPETVLRYIESKGLYQV